MGNTQNRTKKSRLPQKEEIPSKARPITRKAPKSAAVIITCSEGDYAEVMRQARANIKPKELGIKKIRPKRARTGALFLEIPVPDNNGAADALTIQMRQALANKKEVYVSRPVKMAEVRIKNLEDSISSEKVIHTIAEIGKCTRKY